MDRTGIVARAAVATCCLLALFATRWDSSLQHFDWQVWEASDALFDRGENPYDADALNRELQVRPDLYGPHFETPVPMFLFNPPSWFVFFSAVGGSALAASLFGAILLYSSAVWLSRDVDTPRFVSYVFAMTVFLWLGPSLSTFRFGQTGLLTAGLVSVALSFGGTSIGPAAMAMLNYKPHLAFATALPAVFGSPRVTVPRIAFWSTGLVLASVALVGPQAWIDWVASLATQGAHPHLQLGDMSIRTLSGHLPGDQLGKVGLVFGAIGAAALTHRCRAGDEQVTMLACLAVLAYSSGHAFAHDWLWLPLVPIVLRWTMVPTVLSALVAGGILSFWPILWPTAVNPRSVLAMVITVYLCAAAWRRRDGHNRVHAATDQTLETVKAN